MNLTREQAVALSAKIGPMLGCLVRLLELMEKGLDSVPGNRFK